MYDGMKTLCKKNILNANIFLFYIAIIIFCYFCKMDPYLWFDEAGQFWIAKGLNHDSPPMAFEGNVFDVIENNHSYNLDPGGYGLILHFWSMISNHYIWLRSLSFLFFLSFVFCLIFYVGKKTQNNTIALLSGFIPFLFPVFFSEAFEIRAYSMEALGCILGLVCLDRLVESLTNKKLIIMSLLLCIFITSRYSFIVVAFIISLYVIYLIFRAKESIKIRLFFWAIYSLPILFTLVIIYFFSYQYQNSTSGTFFYMKYLSDNPKMLLWDTGLPFVLNIFVLIIFYVNHKQKHIAKYKVLLLVTIAVNLLFIILSFLGLHPWTPNYKHCMSMIILVMICNIILFSEICSLFEKHMQYIPVSVLFIIIIMFCGNYSNVKAVKGINEKSVTDELKEMDLSDMKNIYCDRWESPCIRYQYEYGYLKDKKNNDYGKFHFQTMLKHSIYTKGSAKVDWWKTQCEIDKLDGFDLLIVPEYIRYKPSYDTITWCSYSAGILVKRK